MPGQPAESASMEAPEPSTAVNMWQGLGEALAGIGVGIAVIVNFLRGKKEKPEPEAATHMVLEASSLADMRQITDRLDKVIQALDTANRNDVALAGTQTEILTEMRSQAKDAQEWRENREREELLSLRSEKQMGALLEKLRHGEREHDRDR